MSLQKKKKERKKGLENKVQVIIRNFSMQLILELKDSEK